MNNNFIKEEERKILKWAAKIPHEKIVINKGLYYGKTLYTGYLIKNNCIIGGKKAFLSLEKLLNSLQHLVKGKHESFTNIS